MCEIEVWHVVHIHDKTIREVSKCDDCGKRRLTTQLTLRKGNETRIDFLCNECLTATPPWPRKKVRSV